MTETPESVAKVIRLLSADKWRAHKHLFRHRHPTAPARFHPDLVEEFWSPAPYSQVLAFRGGAKSTYSEEDIVLAACLRAFRNILIIGASETRAAERLASVAYELENNEDIQEIFGRQRAGVWTQTKLVTAHGCIQAMGRDQDIRGIKHLEWRPDLVVFDDFEDKDNVQSPEGRSKTLRWVLAELLPACAPVRKVRVRATPMDAESVPLRLMRDAKWPTRIFPIETIGPSGERSPTWPALFPLDWIDREKKTYIQLGQLDIWAREYMCEAVSDASRTFTEDMIRVRPRVRTWEAVYAMYDPARAVNPQAATTGKAVWSWIRNRLVVWTSSGERWAPDRIVDDIFQTDEEYSPVWIGIEEDGLNEWLLQPIRHEQLRRTTLLPVRPVKAVSGTRGLGKMQFIRGLQPFFAAGEVEFATEQPELKNQLLSFPRGDIDIPNALASALTLRPGAPIYDGFTTDHIVDRLPVDRQRPVYLAFNATRSVVTAVMLQYAYGRLLVFADFVMEGDPAEIAPRIVRDASMLCRAQPIALVGPSHFDQWQNVGLAQALRRVPMQIENGTVPDAGREALREEFARLQRGEPTVRICAGARYTLNALAGGYCRSLTKRGVISNEAEHGLYRVLMEGLESALGSTLGQHNVDNEANWAYTAAGTRYRKYQTAYDRRTP